MPGRSLRSSTGPHLTCIPCGCLGLMPFPRAFLQELLDHGCLHSRGVRRKSADGRVSGGRDLAQTAYYPAGFISAVFKVWITTCVKYTILAPTTSPSSSSSASSSSSSSSSSSRAARLSTCYDSGVHCLICLFCLKIFKSEMFPTPTCHICQVLAVAVDGDGMGKWGRSLLDLLELGRARVEPV